MLKTGDMATCLNKEFDGLIVKTPETKSILTRFFKSPFSTASPGSQLTMPITLTAITSSRLPSIPTDRALQRRAPESIDPHPASFVIPAFFISTDCEKCIYTEEFYATFHEMHTETPEHKAGMKVLKEMEPRQRAQLPLFAGASEDYRKLVIKEIQSVLSSDSQEQDILLLKKHIIVCAVSHGYFTEKDIFGTPSFNLDGVDLSDVALAGFDLTDASLIGTKFTYPVEAPSNILKAPVYGFADPKLYEPVDTEKNIFSKEFYFLFSEANQHGLDYQMGFARLKEMNAIELARLPLYRWASSAYTELVLEAVKEVYYAMSWSYQMDPLKERIRKSAYTHWGYYLFKPVDPDRGIYLNDLYNAFHKDAPETFGKKFSLSLLQALSSEDCAKLPLFEGASERYVELVTYAIRAKLGQSDSDERTTNCKRQIIINAQRFGYINRQDFFGGKLNLNYVNLRGIDLSGLDIANASLVGTDLTDQDLRHVKLEQRNIRETIFNGTKLSRETVVNLIKDKNFVDLSGADLSGLDLSGLSLSNTNLRGANLRGTLLNGTRLCDINLEGADLTDAQLQGANLAYSKLSGACLTGANLTGAELRSVVASDANFSGAILTNVNLASCKLTRVNLERANLTNVSLHEATLVRVNLCRANLTNARLTVAKLTRVNMNEVNLTNAKLISAKLINSSLLNVTVHRTRIKDSKFVDLQTNVHYFVDVARRHEARARAVGRPNAGLRQALDRLAGSGVLSPIQPAYPLPASARRVQLTHQKPMAAPAGSSSWFSPSFSRIRGYFRAFFTRVKTLFGF